MVDIIFYSVMELLTAFAQFHGLCVPGALYGVGMGGDIGLGRRSDGNSAGCQNRRGSFSGILQQGYAFSYLLAAIVYWLVFHISVARVVRG